MIQVAESSSIIETLMREITVFQKLCIVDIERAEEVISSGEQLLKVKNSFPHEWINPKCNELIRIRDTLLDKLSTKMNTLTEYKNLMENIEKVCKIN